MKNLTKKMKNESGQALVEFALLAFLLLTLILGVLEYGWILHEKISINAAAKDAARALVVFESEEKKWKEANKYVVGAGYQWVTPSSEEEEEGLPDSGEVLIVRVKKVVDNPVGFLADKNFPIEGTAKMRME